jgi:hypothetical protein
MAQSLCKNFVHLVFSTKNREPLITHAIQPELFRYLGGILRNWESPSLVVGGVEASAQGFTLGWIIRTLRAWVAL